MTYNKWLSRRWLVCVWAMAMATVLITYGTYKQIDLPWYSQIITFLQVIIVSFMAADSLTKPKEAPK